MQILKIVIASVILLAVTTSTTITSKDQIPFYNGTFQAELYKAQCPDTAAIYLITDSLHKPICYFSDIFSPVCFDLTCKAVQLRIYWDVCGTFLGFKIPHNNPLTKKNHEAFTKYDYYTLYTILNKPNAAIAKLDKQQLVNYGAATADAFTGATSTEAANIVVQGAAFSTYTLWHLANNRKEIQYTNHLKNKSQQYWKEQFISIKNMPANELTLLLYNADRNKILRKYAIQQLLVTNLDSLPAINALLINNYLHRQNYLAPEIAILLKKCSSIENAFNAMLGKN